MSREREYPAIASGLVGRAIFYIPTDSVETTWFQGRAFTVIWNIFQSILINTLVQDIRVVVVEIVLQHTNNIQAGVPTRRV